MKIGVTGSMPSRQAKNPAYMLGFSDVQRLVLDIAEQPKPRREIEPVLDGKSFTVEDMVNVGLLRQEGSLYWIDFNLLTVADQYRIIEASEQLGRDLAQAFVAQRDKLESMAIAHDQPGVGPSEVLFSILGCFSLDWDGLAFTRDQGYREGAQCTIDGHHFTPWAQEEGGEVSLKGLYWGSHTGGGPTYAFTTFGDHHSVPRFGLPDLLWNLRGAFGHYKDLPEGQHAAVGLLDAYATDLLEDIAALMQLLRFSDLSAKELSARTSLGHEKLGPILNLLEMADYIERQGETIRSRGLVLTPGDLDMVRAIRTVGKSIMAKWHEQNYGSLSSRLSHLTPLRNGVPFERVYTEVWHFVFGIANRTLVEERLFADPYAEGRRHKGFLPTIWAQGLSEAP